MPDYLTTAQAAQSLGVSIQRVKQLLAQGRIPGSAKFGASWMIPKTFQVTPVPMGRRRR